MGVRLSDRSDRWSECRGRFWRRGHIWASEGAWSIWPHRGAGKSWPSSPEPFREPVGSWWWTYSECNKSGTEWSYYKLFSVNESSWIIGTCIINISFQFTKFWKWSWSKQKYDISYICHQIYNTTIWFFIIWAYWFQNYNNITEHSITNTIFNSNN